VPVTSDTDAALRFLRTGQAHGVSADALSGSETHMSWLFFAGDRVLKLKKPLRTRYLDHTTLARREFDCREELRLNKRLAPGVHLGWMALQRTPAGYRLVPEELAHPAQATVDWLVCMRRLPEAMALDRRIACRGVDAREIDALGAVLERFYRGAATVRLTASAYREHFASEQRLNREVLLDGRWAPPGVAAALRRYEAALAEHADALEARAKHLVDGHGDLRPEHVFMVEPPVVIDCLEFDARLRCVDPYDELAFLGLECEMAGAPWIGVRLHNRLADRLGDAPPPKVMRVYMAARALLRARLALGHLADECPRDSRKWAALAERYIARASALLRSVEPHAWP
jgi:aminoglycoside phosphotransferase family enzyme